LDENDESAYFDPIESVSEEQVEDYYRNLYKSDSLGLAEYNQMLK
jgi:hypothetical protein